MGGYRSTDHETSRLAYEQMERDGSLSRKRLEIVSALVMHGGFWTAGEIAHFLGANRNNVATRLTELEYLGVVRKVSERRCGVSKKTCWTWGMTGNQPSGAICRPESLSAHVKRLEAENLRLRGELGAARCQIQQTNT